MACSCFIRNHCHFFALLVLLLNNKATFLINSELVYTSEDEANHVGVPYPTPPIVQAFLKDSEFKNLPELQLNDYLLHHQIIYNFCKKRQKRKKGPPEERQCTWKDYYYLLNFIRKPYQKFYDPGRDRIGRQISSLQAEVPFEFEDKCDEIEVPSAKEFFKYVSSSHPFIIRGIASDWPATKRWTLDYLLRHMKGKNVVISLSPSGDFVGPEPTSLWSNDTQYANEDVFLVRPASLVITFEELISIFRSSAKKNRPVSKIKSKLRQPQFEVSNYTFYLEYFPLSAMHEQILNDFQDYNWANFLFLKYKLMWLGGGDSVKNGRLHFDRHENMMTMISGSKTFLMYNPLQSEDLYADLPIRTAALEMHKEFDEEHNKYTISFVRNPEQIDPKRTDISTYTPVNLQQPDYVKYPRLKNIRPMNCTIHKGDMLYIPSHWWHEVTSVDDEEGKSIGINTFYETFYNQRDMKSTSGYVIPNRYYSHLHKGGKVIPCSREKICFRKDPTEQAAKQSKKKAKNTKRNNRRKRRQSTADEL